VVARDRRKVAGILVETALAGDRLRDAVIGIGLNVNWRRAEMPEQISERATSLADIAGSDLDRVALLGVLLDAMDAELAGLVAGGSPLERYRSACATLGARVSVEGPDGPLTGRAAAITDDGALVVEPDGGGAPVSVTGGDVLRLRHEAAP
jgi:BirA family transcriptional regulator, biotin operon repressor / biotin---[acetyl-CoA-carboxylase] ligase